MLEKIKKLKARLTPPRKAALKLDEVEKYIKTEYPDFCPVNSKEVVLNDFTPLLQRDYEGVLNCSLTSMTACIYYLSGGRFSVEDIYAYVHKVAGFFLFTSKLWGTLSFTVKPIYAISLKHFGIKRKIGWKLIKNVGFNSSKIISRINSGTPVMLNLLADGRNCYHNHTVTITGYRIYYGERKNKVFLVLNDNWSKESRVLDYDKLWIISSINY